MACADRGVMPVTYSVRTYRSPAGAHAALSPVDRTSPESGGAARSVADTEVQTHEHPFGVREVADDFLDRLRQPSHERGQSEDLVALSELGPLYEIDDLDLVSTLQMLFADFPQIGES